jgi:hypothetical protein
MKDEMGKAYSTYRVLMRKSKGKRLREILDVGGKLILKWVLTE